MPRLQPCLIADIALAATVTWAMAMAKMRCGLIPSRVISSWPYSRNTFTKDERADLVAWIKHFSPRWQKEKPGTPIQIPPEPEVTPERVKAGEEVYGRVQCWKCHGVQGMANGPSASTLTDDLGRPILAYNFTDGSRPKCGSTDRDIYKIFMTGLDGTPMPSFSDNIKPDEAWDLVFYLRTLQPHNAYNAKEKQIARQLGLKPVSPQ